MRRRLSHGDAEGSGGAPGADNPVALRDDQTRELRTHEVVIRAAAYPVRQGDIVLWRGSRLVVKATRPLTHWLFLDCVTEVR